jgi:hypothetical protein
LFHVVAAAGPAAWVTVQLFRGFGNESLTADTGHGWNC